jgi:hypothetical protein
VNLYFYSIEAFSKITLKTTFGLSPGGIFFFFTPGGKKSGTAKPLKEGVGDANSYMNLLYSSGI